MKTLVTLAAILTILTTSAFADTARLKHDWKSEGCDLVDLTKNYKKKKILDDSETALLVRLLDRTESELREGKSKKEKALAAFISAMRLESDAKIITLADALEGVDGGYSRDANIEPDFRVYELQSKQDASKTYLYFDFYSGDNAAGVISTLDGSRLVGGNSDGDFFCYR